jgi:hypothetical protein
MRREWINTAGMLLLAAVWGLSIPFTKLDLESLSPLTLTAPLRHRRAVAVHSAKYRSRITNGSSAQPIIDLGAS